MLWNVILGFFAAFGVLCALWAVLGAFLPGSKDCHILLESPKKDRLSTLRRLCWLREAGLLRANITVLDSGLHPKQQRMIHNKYPYIHFRNSGKECPEDDATGNGNTAGHHCRRGISEL